MFNITRVERQIGGRTLSIETGKLARQAAGATVVQYGETVVLVAVCTAPPRSEEQDFFPLNVDYREKTSAAGKFPGGFIKREGRPSTKEVLTARMIDRPLRPLFPEGYVDEVQIMATVLSADQENDPDILSVIGASAALSISKIPFLGPIGACRIGRVNGEFVVNPLHSQEAESDMDLLLCGRKDSVNMIEVGAKQLPEEVVSEAIAKAHDVIRQICELIEELVEKIGPVEKQFELQEFNQELFEKVSAEISKKLYAAKQVEGKLERQQAVDAIFEEMKQKYTAAAEGAAAICTPFTMNNILQKIEGQVVRKLLLEGKRPDGRSFTAVRPISCEVGVLPRTHGSALFTRGETQSLVTATLGTIRDAQIIDGLNEETEQRFMLHYNFPPFSVGEVRPIRGPGRREIGHGALAERALEQVKPPFEDFTYTIRLVSDILESNGSSSMASVCGGTLAMMDAGIPIIAPVAGISIGLITDDNKQHLLTDIIGDEDHYGDMDFKVTGTTKGITAIQLDIKIDGLTHDTITAALKQAKAARLEILETMQKAISKPRAELSPYAPKMISIKIDPEKIGKVIGPGGSVVKSIQDQTGTTIAIEEDGTIFISCLGGDGHLKAKEIIESIAMPPQIGKVYENAKVVSAKDFGAFVEISPGVEGLCHISELSDAYVKSVDQVCKIGDILPVKLLAIDEQGRLRLSHKAVLVERKKEGAQAKH
ncbi:MAG TPA: polyribonucleotide nucleotidyltransferase [Sedimentisphaerales bacterium]|nr:polyribonucleotide nucleotidyltransferase [Sedimentisphaerales bacterium]